MNCLVLTPHRYGIREVAERVGAEWEAMGHSVDYELARGDAARIGPVTIGTPGIAIWWYRQLDRVANGNDRYDLVWTHQPVAPLLPTEDSSLWDSVLVTFHTTLRAEYELAVDGGYPARLRPYHWLTKTLEARFYRKLQSLDTAGPRYTVVSPHLRDEISAFGVEDATYVPNGLVTPDREAFEPVRAEYDIPENATLVVSIGSLTPQKRAAECARIVREVTEQTDDIYCVLAGMGPLQDAVEQHTSDRVRVPGYVSDEEKWRWLHDADAFVSLSAYEGMPVATLEALSAGLPVVLSDIPAHRHVISEYDTTGALVALDPDDVLTGVRRVADGSAAVSLPDWGEVARAYLAAASPRGKRRNPL